MADLELMDPVQIDADLRRRDLRIEALEAESNTKEMYLDQFRATNERHCAEIKRLREALGVIKRLKPQKIVDTEFCTGPRALFDQAQRVARNALKAS